MVGELKNTVEEILKKYECTIIEDSYKISDYINSELRKNVLKKIFKK